MGIATSCVDDAWLAKPRRALLARFSHPWESASWALLGGGFGEASGYVCCEVRNEDLPIGLDATHLLRERLRGLSVHGMAEGCTDWVATMTSAHVAGYACGQAHEQAATACTLVTAGFANALRVGESQRGLARAYQPGTINLACWVNQPLTREAKLEALSIVAQARTLEVLDARVPSFDESGWATGTGTDCLVLFSPRPAPYQSRHAYTGMHTALGQVIGAAVREAMREAIEGWRKRGRA